MNTETIGILAGILVAISVIPYAIRAWQGLIEPNLTSWSIWALTGFVILITYEGSGADSSVWPALFNFLNPFLIVLILFINIKKKPKLLKLTSTEKACLFICLVSLTLYIIFKGNEDLVQYALYLAILADAFACIPTLIFVWHSPLADRPFAWGVFTLGFFLSLFAITDHNLANYSLPIYMSVAGSIIVAMLIVPRIKQRVPLHKWY